MAVVNLNSLCNKLSYVRDFLNFNSLCVLAVTETWLVSGTPSSFSDVSGYVFFRGDVGGTVRKHGAGVYVRDTLGAVAVQVEIRNLAVVYVDVWQLYVVVVYRPPSYSSEENESLLQFLADFCACRRVIMLGDFNLPTLKWPESGIEEGYIAPLDMKFYDQFLLLGLVQVVHMPTFVQSGNVLDLVFAADAEAVGEVSVSAPLPGCHHSPVVFSYQVFAGAEQKEPDVVPLWHKGNYRLVREQLCLVDWDTEFETLTMEDCYGYFLDVLDSLVARHVPVVEVGRGAERESTRPPRSLVRRKTTAWNEYTRVRAAAGRSSGEAKLAWERFSAVNREYRAFSLNQRWDYEMYLVQSLSDAPKKFHSYITAHCISRPADIHLLRVPRLLESSITT